ncbi:tetratricopeptide repeat protein [Streptomyces sp. NPDC050085]|uniref:tetratricopeptide repeat protein n=1 Tax=Streptomyces sp. NPDC050085 TaxID=3365600 RepID=UPI0037B9E024
MARRDRETAGLDSCEHLVDECRLLISDLLTAVPALTVLATSRQTLQLRDECVVEIGPLSFADGDPKRSDAMRLFTSRAAEVAPGTDLSSPSAQAAAVAVCRRLVAHAEARWAGSEQVLAYRHVNDAFPDICAALDHLLAVAPAEGLDLAARVGFFWSCCGHLHEARAYLERGLALHGVPQSVRGRGLWALGVVLVLQGEYDQAEQLGTVCTRLAQQGEDDEAALAAAYLLGITYLMTGRPLAAHTAAERALSDTQADVGSAARLRCRLVAVFACTALGALSEAETLARRLLADCDRTGEVWARSYLDYQLALLALLQDRPRDAAVHARAMLQGKQLLGDRFGTALGIDVLAAALAEDGREEDAALLSGVGQAYWHAVGHVQRGTPELAPVRERTRQLALAALGEDVYALARRRGAQDTEGGLVLALDDGC